MVGYEAVSGPGAASVYLLGEVMSRVFVYVDALNLYYGCLRDTPYRWLDLDRLARCLLHGSDTVDRVRYFTAKVASRPADPGQHTRQGTYLRAIKTLPRLTVHLGQFRRRRKTLPLAGDPNESRVKVIVDEEKGSDVNLATHLVHDAHRNRFDTALVITNDTDLIEPIRVVREGVGKPVGVAFPVAREGRRPHRDLVATASFVREIRRGVLRTAQFPETLHDDHGAFRRPEAWA